MGWSRCKFHSSEPSVQVYKAEIYEALWPQNCNVVIFPNIPAAGWHKKSKTLYSSTLYHVPTLPVVASCKYLTSGLHPFALMQQVKSNSYFWYHLRPYFHPVPTINLTVNLSPDRDWKAPKEFHFTRQGPKLCVLCKVFQVTSLPLLPAVCPWWVISLRICRINLKCTAVGAIFCENFFFSLYNFKVYVRRAHSWRGLFYENLI